jgi:hypothetical protein
MTTIKKLMYIEEILLKADNDYRYSYTLDELIKSEKYIKEIGEITNLFFAIQIEYSKVCNAKDKEYKQKLVDYHNKLIYSQIDIDTKKYIDFLKSMKNKYPQDKDYIEKIEKLSAEN